jgi:BirA family biotin operon repressor/biotin-[acetyl-CoA-carboxylase] ligase
MFPFVIEMHEQLDSTNSAAKQRILKQEDLSYHALLCRDQKKGRGTKGRSWVSLDGNIFLSAVIPLPGVPDSEQLSLSSGLAVLRTVELLCSAPDISAAPQISLKWPNDVLINGEKVSGILIEIVESFAVIGVGLNLVDAPPLATYLNKYANNVSFWPAVYTLLLKLSTIAAKTRYPAEKLEWCVNKKNIQTPPI